MEKDTPFQENVINAMAQDYENLHDRPVNITQKSGMRRTIIHVVVGLAIALVVVVLATIGITY